MRNYFLGLCLLFALCFTACSHSDDSVDVLIIGGGANELPAGYLKARGRISRNLTYCQLLSGRLTLSRQEALKYGRYFVKDPIGKLMNMTKHTPITWWMLAKLLQYREYHRK
mgnify:CR=1 FL=1